MPPRMRLNPLSSAADAKEGKERCTPGKSSEPTVKATSSVPKNKARTAAAAPLKVLWPEVYSGNGGVSNNGTQVASEIVSGLSSESAKIGRASCRERL